MNRTVQTSQTLRTSQTGSLYLCVISAPSSEVRDQVAKHLRYWPHVKFFKYQGARHLLCCFCLGEAKDGYQLKQLYERSRLLVLLCLRQYDVTITRWKPLPDDFKLHHDRPVVIRPDETLKPLIIYMGDSVSGCTKGVPIYSSGRPFSPQNFKKIYKKISQYILNNFRVNF